VDGSAHTFIPSDDNARLGLKVSINIFQGPVGRFGVEKIGEWDEAEADTSPDDPKSPPQILDARGSNLDHHVILQISVSRFEMMSLLWRG
jgi:hypothetical protein